ncbi:MAG: ABC transporter permease [Sphaerochaetaceae bacterium]|nr:ABC transporter permease [Sphaerochaetaceae bacterium]
MKSFWKNVLRLAIRNKGSMIGAILIISLGMLVFGGMLNGVVCTRTAKDSYIDRANVSDIFASVVGIPRSAAVSLTDIKGIRSVSGKLVQNIRMASIDSDDLTSLQVIGFDENESSDLVFLSGEPPRENDIYIGPRMQKEFNFQIGDVIDLTRDGVDMKFFFAGVCDSPLYMDVISESAYAQDGSVYDIAVIDKTRLEKICEKTDAYTTVTFMLENGYEFGDVKQEIEAALAPYGLKDLRERKEQDSIKSVNESIKVMLQAGVAFPVMFLAIAVFMLYSILRKMVARDQTLIGTMKAFGMTDGELISAYLVQGAAIGFLGAYLASWISPYFGEYLFNDSNSYYNFGGVYYTDITINALSFIIAMVTGVVASYLSVKMILQINPAQAMRPPAPTGGINLRLPSFLEKAGSLAKIGFKNVTRNPINGVLVATAVAFSFALVVSMGSFPGVLNKSLDMKYRVFEPFDINVTLTRFDDPDEIARSAMSIDGVIEAEGIGSFYGQILKGQKSDYKMMKFVNEEVAIRKIVDKDDVYHRPVAGGVLLNAATAKKLDVKKGDTIQILIPELSDRKVDFYVSDIVTEVIGGTAYFLFDSMPECFGVPKTANTLLIRTEKGRTNDVKAKLKEAFNSSMVTIASRDEYCFRLDMKSTSLVTTMLMGFGLIAGAIITYCISMINIRERITELGTLLILGEDHDSIGKMIIVEQMIYFLFGAVIGFPMSLGFCRVLTNLLTRDDLAMTIIPGWGVCGKMFLVELAVVLLSGFMQFLTVEKIKLTDILKERC